MDIKKTGRRIQVTCKYGSAMHKFCRIRKYKWDGDAKVWWKGFTAKEMEAVELERDRICGAIDSIQSRIANSIAITASYDDTYRVKDKLKSIVGVFYAGKAWRADNEAAADAAWAVIREARPKPAKPKPGIVLADGERRVSVGKEFRANFVGGTINIGGVPHKCVREIRAYRFVDGLSQGMRCDDGWNHELVVRPLTDAEQSAKSKADEIEELKRQLRYYTGPLDDDRNAQRFETLANEISIKLDELSNV